MNHFNQISLIAAIMRELDRQQPGAVISQAQMNAIIGAADLVLLAMRDASSYQIATQVAAICTLSAGDAMTGYPGVDWNYYPKTIKSPYKPYGREYNKMVFNWFLKQKDEPLFDVHPDMEDADWEMDCQDVHDVLRYLDLTGNLDAPL
ncbi:MAG: hypothetical protein NHG36_20175 [Chromatiaceae bacterium]|nr:hypothetical protein [Candidatus Thioaporhodococcus sediminis]